MAKAVLSPATKNAVTESLTNLIKRAMAARDAVRAAKAADDGESVLPNEVGREIRSMAASLGTILSAHPSGVWN